MSTEESRPDVRVVADVADAAARAFVELGPELVVLSGGTTPREFYRRIADLAHPWDRVEFFFGDERCVPATSELSNVRMAREALLDRIRPKAVHAMQGQTCDAGGYERLLRERFGDALGFDLAVYGLGPDGHTASLFPGRPEVEETVRWVAHVPEAGMEPLVPRITLTVPALSAARVGMFLVEGAGKRTALRRLLAGEDVPAARVRPERLLILTDREAIGEGER